MVALLLGVAGIRQASAHAELIRSDPPSEGLLTVPLGQLDLWFSEPVGIGEGSPSIEIVDASGSTVPVSDRRVDAADSTHVIVEADVVLPGTYTIIWSVRSDIDGHALSGTYSFRVGGGTAPGAATVEGEIPASWAVATRWITFLGSALAAAGFLFGVTLLGTGAELDALGRRRRLVVLAGALIALVATVLEPVLQTRWPPSGTVAPSLADAIAALPDAWWLRPAALLAVIALAFSTWRAWLRGNDVDWLGGAFALVGLLGLSLTSHSAAEQGAWRLPAIASNVAHQWSIALWSGGLAHLAIWWSGRRVGQGGERDEQAQRTLTQFSRVAFGLVVIGIGTGVANAGLLLPAIRSLWTTDYGFVLLVKLGLLVLPLTLAAFHHRAIRAALQRLRPRFQRTIRLEASLVLVVALAGSSLALMAAPLTASKPSLTADVPKPALEAIDGQNLLVHLLYAPGTAGDNRLGLRIANYDSSPYTGEPPARVRLRLVSLDQEVESGPLELGSGANGDWVADGETVIPFDGWWRIEATLRWLGQEDVIVPFYVLLPDPNLNGFDAPVTPESDPQAAALYEQAMGVYTSWNTVRFSQSMSSHMGVTAYAVHVVNDGADGSTPGYSYSAVGGFDAVVIGTTGWMKRHGEAWRTIDVNPMIPPSEWDNEYAGATGFRLGRIDDVNGEPAQIITFVVPGNGKQVTAWYVWWFGLDSGQVLRDVMVSNGHYMTTDYYGFNEPAPLSPPSDPSASPVP